MAIIAIAFLLSLVTYLALTAGSGTVLSLWSAGELAFGVFFAMVSAGLAWRLSRTLDVRPRLVALNPLRWIYFIVYAAGPFLYQMAKANLDVAYRVITGRIRPGIVRIKPGLKTSFGVTMLANSITLTPGTLTVDVGEDKSLYVHWINVKTKNPRTEDICSNFHEWARRVAE